MFKYLLLMSYESVVVQPPSEAKFNSFSNLRKSWRFLFVKVIFCKILPPLYWIVIIPFFLGWYNETSKSFATKLLPSFVIIILKRVLLKHVAIFPLAAVLPVMSNNFSRLDALIGHILPEMKNQSISSVTAWFFSIHPQLVLNATVNYNVKHAAI